MKYRVCVDDNNVQVILSDIYPEPHKEMDVECGYHRYRTKILSWNRETGIGAVLLDDVPYDVEIFRDTQGTIEGVKIDNEVFAVDEVYAGRVTAPRPDSGPVKGGVLKAFMPGLVARVLKQQGDPVKEGETVLFLEAMKMENAITAPRDGVLSRIAVKDGATVLTNDILFVVE